MSDTQQSRVLRLLSENSDIKELQRTLGTIDNKSLDQVLDQLFEDFLDTNTHKDATESLSRLITAVGTNKNSPLSQEHTKLITDFLLLRIPGIINQKNVEGNIHLFLLIQKYFPEILRKAAYRNMYIVGNYFVSGIVLGSGNFSKVFIGRHLRTAQAVAIKWINLAQQSTQARLMIEREVQMMKKIHHPNIVQLYDVLTQSEDLYIVMEYCTGETLENYMKNNIIAEKTALYILREICIGLIYLYKKGIIHRDIKPANILLSYDQILRNEDGFTVKLADFTFAKTFDNQLDQTYCGTPLFMSPEMLFGNNDGPNQKKNGDLWSVGVIFYQMLYNAPPYTCKNLVQLQDALRNFRLRIPQIPYVSQETKHLLTGLLEKDASRRFSFEDLEPLITVTKEVEREEEKHNKEYQKYEEEISHLETLLKPLLTQNLKSRSRQEALLAEIEEIEQLNRELRKTNEDRESIISNLETLVENGLTSLKMC